MAGSKVKVKVTSPSKFEFLPFSTLISKITYLFIASGKLGMFQRQMGVASVAYEKVFSKRDMLVSVLSYVSVDGCAI